MGPSATNRLGASHDVIVAGQSMPGPKVHTSCPPWRSSLRVGTNHDEIPGPVAIARQTSSGVPGTSTSTCTDRRPDGSFFTLTSFPFLWLPGRGIRPDHQAMSTPARCGLVVITRDQCGDRGGQFTAKSGTVLGGPESHLCVDGECRKAFVEFFGLAKQLSDLADHSGRQRHEIARGQPIHSSRGIRPDRTKRAGRDNVRGCCRHQPPLRQSAPSLRAVHPDQPVHFQRSQVVVHLLPRQPHAGGQCRRGCRRAKLREEPTAHGIQCHAG